MQLLSKLPSLEEYSRELSLLLDAPSTHIYVDTSFLMWLSKLGRAARTEFLEWTKQVGQGRIHIPLWASHEYHQHYIDTSISKSTKEFVANLNKAAKNFYSELMPAIVEANMPPRWTSEHIKTDTRQAVVELMRYGDIIDRWCDQTLDERTSSVIAFINQHCLTSGRTFEYLNTVGQTTDNRFSGRVPPGFQDRVKKDTTEEGGNRSGDLMFWKEILDHARDANRFPLRGVRSIVVLTNDMKNDWVAGGKPASQDSTIEELRGVLRDGARIPVIHPMLEHEAQIYSKAARVMLMNNYALGLQFLLAKKAPTFVEVTVTAQMPRGDRKDTILGKAGMRPAAPPAPLAAAPAAPTHAAAGVRAADSNSGINDQLIAPTQLLTLATTDPAKGLALAKQVVDEMLSIDGLQKPITAWLTEDILASADPKKLIWVGRMLAEGAVQNVTNASARVVDLLSEIKELGANPASQLYTGVLFGFYFDKENLQLAAPKPEVLQLAFKYQGDRFAAPGMEALRAAFTVGDRPAYLPSANLAQIEAEAVATLQNKSLSLTAIMIGGVDFLVTLGEGDVLSLFKLLGIRTTDGKREAVPSHDLISSVARAIGFPTDQVQVKGNVNRVISISPTDGIDITRNGEI